MVWTCQYILLVVAKRMPEVHVRRTRLVAGVESLERIAHDPQDVPDEETHEPRRREQRQQNATTKRTHANHTDHAARRTRRLRTNRLQSRTSSNPIISKPTLWSMASRISSPLSWSVASTWTRSSGRYFRLRWRGISERQGSLDSCPSEIRSRGRKGRRRD